VGLKFNPPPGWPLPYDFEPWPGWEPDPSWPAAPPGWPLWIGSSAPSIDREDPRLGYAARHARQPQVSADDQPRDQRQRESRPDRAGGRARGPRRRYRPSALTSVAAGLVGIAAIAVIVIAAYRQVAGGPVAGQRTVSFTSLRPGDCFQNPPGHQLTSGQVADVITVACTTAHNAQLLARFPVNRYRSYPGQDALATRSTEACRAAVTAVLKSDHRGSARVLRLFPDERAWRSGFRSISCVVVDTTRDLTGSLAPPKRDDGGPQGPGPSGSSQHSPASSHRPGSGSHKHSKGPGRP
jgi:hypothetical protein